MNKKFIAKKKLVEYKSRLEPYLVNFLREKEKEYKEVSIFSHNFVKALSEYTLRGGKRLRAALIFYTYKMFGGQKDEEAIKLSMFVELLQSFLLIHDDVFDRSDLRRGGGTMHKIYEKYAKNQGYEDPAFFGEVMAILNGDIANQMAFEIIANANFDAEIKVKIMRTVSNKIKHVIIGEAEDCLLPFVDKYVEEDIIKIFIYKTATYTYQLPILTGAVLGCATSKEMRLLAEFGKYVGIAYQIQDDYLGLFGTEGKLGKSTVSDLQEGKKTLFMLDVMENGSDKQKQVIDQYLGKKDITHKEAEQVKDVVRASGALDRVQAKSIKFTKKGLTFLNRLKYRDTKGWIFLKDVAEYMIRRNK